MEKTKKKSINGKCQSCLMPFKKDPKGKNREHADYCSYCYADGRLCYAGSDVKEFKAGMIHSMMARGANPLKAKFFAYMAGFAPRWKNQS